MQIVDVMDKLPRKPGKHYRGRLPEKISQVVVHHSAAAFLKSRPALEQLQGFARYHVNEHGWPGIGYHYAIEPNGTVYKCNPVLVTTYHARGANADGVGVMLMGNFELTEPTAQQLQSLAGVIEALRRGLPNKLKVVGHRDVGSTACPGKHLTPAMLKRLNV